MRSVVEALRQTGIGVIGDVMWGSHFCQFYETKEDLIDILVPYFKAGLESNEFCMWFTAHLTLDEAREALSQAVPNLDHYIDQGQMELIPHNEWYLRDGAFNAQPVLSGWISKLNSGRDRGFAGLRISGNTFWLENKDWKDFVLYESVANSLIHRHQIIAICTYPLNRCEPFELIDVVSNHPFVLFRRAGKWELVENTTHNSAPSLKKSGLSYAEIGRRLNLSGERVRQILKRKRTQWDKSSYSNPGTLLTVSEAAKRLGVHTNTIRCWSAKGILKPYRIGQRQDRRFKSRDLDDFISSMHEPRT